MIDPHFSFKPKDDQPLNMFNSAQNHNDVNYEANNNNCFSTNEGALSEEPRQIIDNIRRNLEESKRQIENAVRDSADFLHNEV